MFGANSESPSGRAPTLFAAAVALAALMVLVLAAGARDAQAGGGITFEPGGVKCFETLETPAVCDGDASPGAVTDLHTRFCVGWNADCTSQSMFGTDSLPGDGLDFIPQHLNYGSSGDIPIGALAGRMVQDRTLGVLNSPCQTRIGIAYTLMKASTNIHDTLGPRPAGDDDVLEPFVLDSNENGLPDGVDRYPSFLNEIFEDQVPVARLFGVTLIQGNWSTINIVIFEPGAPVPVGGVVVSPLPNLGLPAILVADDPSAVEPTLPISDSCAPLLWDMILLGHTLDNPCTPADVQGAACLGTLLSYQNENRGVPLFPCETGNAFDEDGDGVINDGCPQAGATPESGEECENKVSDDPEDADINDGCPQVGVTSEGERIIGGCLDHDEGGCRQLQNSDSPGAINTAIVSVSRRDADGDGIENELDVCALVANSEWDPRTFDAANDPDNDGLPNVCDPHPQIGGSQSPFSCPAGVVGTDEDQDCYSNRQDNCPTVNQLVDPSELPDVDVNPSLPEDGDGDGIGDACDPNPESADSEGIVVYVCLLFQLAIGGESSPVVGEPAALEKCLLISQAKGDVNCSQQIGSFDAIDVLRHVAGIPVSGPIADQASSACPDIGDPGPPLWGDMDCDGDVDAVDALRILQFIAGLPVDLPPGCMAIGTPV